MCLFNVEVTNKKQEQNFLLIKILKNSNTTINFNFPSSSLERWQICRISNLSTLIETNGAINN